MSPWSFEKGGRGMPLFVHIAVGTFIGMLAAAFVIWRVAVWQAEVGLAAAAAAVRQANEAIVQRERRTRQEAAQLEQDRRAQAVAAQRAAETARRQAQEAAARREAAWAAFYRKPAACDDTRGGSWTVDCANEFIRAKQRFAALYDAGKL